MGIGALSAFIQARAVGTIFLDGTTSAPQTTPARKLGSFAVYDATSGDVLHHLTVEAMPGAPETLQSPAEIEQGAIDVAARTSQRDPASLRVLALGTRTLNPQSSFRIDPTTLALEEHAPPTR